MTSRYLLTLHCPLATREPACRSPFASRSLRHLSYTVSLRRHLVWSHMLTSSSSTPEWRASTPKLRFSHRDKRVKRPSDHVHRTRGNIFSASKLRKSISAAAFAPASALSYTTAARPGEERRNLWVEQRSIFKVQATALQEYFPSYGVSLELNPYVYTHADPASRASLCECYTYNRTAVTQRLMSTNHLMRLAAASLPASTLCLWLARPSSIGPFTRFISDSVSFVNGRLARTFYWLTA